MSDERNAVNAIQDPRHIEKAGEYIRKHYDKCFYLIFSLGLNTGYRISDLCELTYKNFNYADNTITINENKGTKANIARARGKIIRAAVKKIKGNLLLQQDINAYIALGDADTTDEMYTELRHLMTTKQFLKLEVKIADAIKKAPKKTRTASVPKWIINIVKKRETEFAGVDDGKLFACNTLSSSRAVGTKCVTRQSCWKVFSSLTSFLKGLYKSLSDKFKVGCHSLRKSYCLTLFVKNNNDISLVMELVGHATEKQSLTYIDRTSDVQKKAAANVHDSLKPQHIIDEEAMLAA